MVKDNRGGIVSLLMMLTFYAESFCRVSGILGQALMLLNAPGYDLSPNAAGTLGGHLGELQREAERLELRFVVVHVQRIRKVIDNNNFTKAELAQLLAELQIRLLDELGDRLVLFIPADRRPYYEHKEPLFGKNVADAFPGAAFDIDEAGKSYALGRGTACVFHLQRALEIVLKALAHNLGQRLDRNTWDAHLKDINRELENRYKNSVARSEQEQFYAEAAAQFGHVKTAWRNPTMHVDKTHTEEDALNIFNAVKSFMSHLSTKLKEES